MDELYDLEADIGERNNLAEKHPDIVSELKKLTKELESKRVTVEGPTEFQIRLKEKGAGGPSGRIKVNSDPESVMFEVSDESGIGGGSIHLRSGQWPKKVLLRIHLPGLEGFEIKVGEEEFSGAYHGDGAPRPDNYLPTRMVDVAGSPLSGRYLVEAVEGVGSRRREGYYEVEVPQSLLRSKARTMELSWVDFYRR